MNYSTVMADYLRSVESAWDRKRNPENSIYWSAVQEEFPELARAYEAISAAENSFAAVLDHLIATTP